MKFACVTLSYNQDKFLAAAIESIVGQNEEIDYLVYDPGSKDNSRNIICGYETRNVRHHFVQGDSGPAEGLNVGLSQVSGDIFYYLNSDDVVLPGAFKFVRKYFEDNSDCDVLHGSIQVINEEGKIERNLPSMEFSPMAMILGSSVVYQQATFFRKSCLPESPFNELNKVSWDGELVFRLSLAGAKIHRTEMLLGQFRIYSASITGSKKFRKLAKKHKADLARTYLGRDLHVYEKYFGFFLQKRNALLRRVKPKIQFLN